MASSAHNKLKIFNDPVYGFVNVPDEGIFDLIETPWFQRLRHIKQLGMTHLVYPGALHTRFHHAMGAMYLMGQAVEILRFKGHDLSDQDARALTQTIILHDIGHGPFSHALEHTLVEGLTHEDLTLLIMERLNQSGVHNLDEAIRIFQNTHPHTYLHQLVSGQIDMDRLDYLNRDSFFTGVSEGVVSWDRIIKMLNIKNGQVVIDEKGIYSIEKFIIARRLMYWQVYLHKTVLAAENMLTSLLRRARQLARAGEKLPASQALLRLLNGNHQKSDFRKDPTLLDDFLLLDDHDLHCAIKAWIDHSDPILSRLAKGIVFRRLFRIEISKSPFSDDYIHGIKQCVIRQFDLPHSQDAAYLVVGGLTTNNAYDPGSRGIQILSREGTLTELSQASDQLNISLLSHPVEKYYLCYPKELKL